MPHLRATALLLGGRLAYVQDDRVEERALLEASLALFEECGDLLAPPAPVPSLHGAASLISAWTKLTRWQSAP